MDRDLRRAYNAAFTEERYRRLTASLDEYAGFEVAFRVCETPLFLTAELMREAERAAEATLAEVMAPEYLAVAERAVPSECAVPGGASSPFPHFLCIDFALAVGESGELGDVTPRLIELQGFPSLFGFQWLLGRAYREAFDLDPGLTPYFHGIDEGEYSARLTRQLVGTGDPEETVLLEIEPQKQKTRIDFEATTRLTGVEAIGVDQVIPRGDRLYRRDAAGREIPIRRIYNRVIFDEADRKGLDLDAIFRRPYDVEWVGHPDWFYKISKFSLPFVKNQWSPPCWLVSELPEIPHDLDRYVLKPLRSFAGLGVELDVTAERLRSLANPADYILQKKVEYAPIIETPDGLARAELRMMYLWEDEGPRLVTNLVRMTKGKMVGVDFNKDKTWIGASIALHPA